MRSLTLIPLLAVVLSGCSAIRGPFPQLLSTLDISEQYSPSTGAGPLAVESLNDCWSWLDDPMLAALQQTAPDAQSRGALARTYMTLRGRQARVANAGAYLADQQDNLEIARFRQEARLVTARDAAQADAERARVAATLPGLEARNTSDAARIAVLSGRAPAALRDQLTPAGPIPTEPAAIGIGTPSDLLTHRPDLKIRAGMGEKARADYRRAVLAALEQVEDAQASFDGAVAGARALADAADKVEELTRLVRRQYREGLADYAALSTAEMALLDARDALADARASRAAAATDLCVALGGGR